MKDYLKNRTLIMLFEKTSTRTRLSFEAAMTELGGHAIFLDAKTTQFSLTDFGDEIQAVMRFGDLLMFRAQSAADVDLAASYNQIPVIDACSEKYHPAQAISDLLTMSEYSGGLENIKNLPEDEVTGCGDAAFVPDGIIISFIILDKNVEDSYENIKNFCINNVSEIQKCETSFKKVNGNNFFVINKWNIPCDRPTAYLFKDSRYIISSAWSNQVSIEKQKQYSNLFYAILNTVKFE